MKTPPVASLSRARRAALGVVCALVVAVFLASAHPGLIERLGGGPARSYYNLLVEGFQAGQLSLRKEVPPALARLADPYDPAANLPFRTPPTLADDLSFYRGRFHLYFGLTPALLLFWPWAAVTGRYLGHAAAVTGFCSAGFLAAAWLLAALRRRYFPAVPVEVAALGALALGLASGLPVLLQRSDVYEVSISCAYLLVALALAALWQAWHAPARRAAWLAAAGFSFGLAVGARPPVLFCGAVLLLPAVAGAGEPGRKALARRLLAALLPLAACGLGLMLYNFRRFGSVLEFGQHYQLSGIRQDTVRHFSPSYLWFNFRVYFLEPMRWQPRFPFLTNIAPPPLPPGHGIVEKPFSPFGVLAGIPLAGFALAAPLALRRVADGALRPRLAGFLAAVTILFVVPALITCLFFGTCSRYEVEFLPALVLLAAVGVLALESGPAPRRTLRAAWIAALVLSVAFNLCASFERYALEHVYAGSAYSDLGRLPEAIAQFRAALRMEPDYADAHLDLGVALARSGRLPEAIAEFSAALQDDPARADAQDDLGNALVQAGRLPEAIAHYRAALRLQPDSAQAHYNLALALQSTGQSGEARAEYEQAIRLDPRLAPRAP